MYAKFNAVLSAVLLLSSLTVWAADAPLPAPPLPAPAPAADVANPLAPLGPGDSLALEVFGQPDMDGPLTVAADGTVRIPLVGPVQVRDLSVNQAARRIETAFKSGGYFVNPHVTLTLMQSVSQRVSVLGEVRTPGLYPIDSTTTVFDLLARAGGLNQAGSRIIYILRPDAHGQVQRYPVNLENLADPTNQSSVQLLHAGDSIYVPPAQQFSIYGEVQKAGRYDLEPGLKVVDAIALAGGLTPKGSYRRVEIHRTLQDGTQVNIRPRLNDAVQPGDAIRVKESIF